MALVGYSLFPGASRAADRPGVVSDQVAARLYGGDSCTTIITPDFKNWCDPNNFPNCGIQAKAADGITYTDVTTLPCSDKCNFNYPSTVTLCYGSVVGP
jgi:hypothetical protein